MGDTKVGQVWEIDDVLYSARFHVTYVDNQFVKMVCFSISHKNPSQGFCDDFETGEEYIFTHNFYDYDGSWELLFDSGQAADVNEPPTCSKCNTINEYTEHDPSEGPYICYRCKSGF